jgi:hypothetical protein
MSDDGLINEEIARMKLQAIYRMDDFLQCPALRERILADHQMSLDNTLRPALEREAAKIYLDTKMSESNVLDSTRESQFVGAIVGLVLSRIEPRLSDASVYTTPEESLACLESHFGERRAMSRQRPSKTTRPGQTVAP